MDKQPFLDRSILIPIGIGLFSILGIGIIFLIVYIDKQQTGAPTDATVTPFKYLLLATETGMPDPALETPTPIEAFLEETFTEEPEEPTNSLLTDTPRVNFSTPEVVTAVATAEASALPSETSESVPASPTITPTSVAGLSVKERYDNVDSRLDYDGDWSNETNVTNAYQRT